MPTLCNTTYKCVGDKKEIQSLYYLIQQMQQSDKPIIENESGNMWLGNLVTLLGADWNQYSCRGKITFYLLEDNVLTIEQETAWLEQKGIRELINDKFPSIKVYFTDENFEDYYFSTNDKDGIYCKHRYFIDSSEDGFMEFDDIESLAEFVSKMTESKINADLIEVRATIAEYTDKIEEAGDDYFYCNFYEYQIVD